MSTGSGEGCAYVRRLMFPVRAEKGWPSALPLPVGSVGAGLVLVVGWRKAIQSLRLRQSGIPPDERTTLLQTQGSSKSVQ
jgi:hypothetical protein